MEAAYYVNQAELGVNDAMSAYSAGWMDIALPERLVLALVGVPDQEDPEHALEPLGAPVHPVVLASRSYRTHQPLDDVRGVRDVDAMNRELGEGHHEPGVAGYELRRSRESSLQEILREILQLQQR